MQQALDQTNPTVSQDWRRFLPAITAALLGIILTGGMFLAAREYDERRLQLEFNDQGDEIETILQSRVAGNIELLQSIANFHAASVEVSPDEFRRFTQTALNRPSVRALGWASSEPDGFIVRFIEPIDRYGDFAGRDLSEDEASRRAIEQAIEQATPASTSGLIWGDGDDRKFDCLIALPSYRSVTPPADPVQRRQELVGLAIGLLRFGPAVEQVQQMINIRGQELQLIDLDPVRGASILYDTHDTAANVRPPSSIFRIDLEPWENKIDVAGRRLILRGIPTSEYIGGQQRRGPWFMLAGGLLFTGLISSYIHTISNRASRIAALVSRRTEQLASANRQLEAESEQRLRTLDALRQSEERHRAVMEQAAEGIYLVDAENHTIIEANAAMARLMGYSLEEVRGRPIYDFVSDSREAVSARMQLVLGASGPVVGERQYLRKDGTLIDVGVSATVIQYAGRRVLCTVVHDITERKRAQKLLEEKNDQLEQAINAEKRSHQKLKSAQGQLVQAEKLAGLGQMVAGVAHEINNPLSFVANNVAVLQRDLAPIRKLLEMYRSHDALLAQHAPQALREIEELIEQIDLAYTLDNIDEVLVRSRDGLRRIQQIVKDLRDFARLDEGDFHDADLNAGIQSTVNIILGRARKRKIKVDLQLGTLPLVACHPAKINQVIMNLISNAIDASPDGATVTVVSRRCGEEICIDVRDTGRGIPADIRGRIFDPFFTTKPPGQGTGLGLSISYGIIQEHGGRIELESTPGQGSTFTIHLPLKPHVET